MSTSRQGFGFRAWVSGTLDLWVYGVGRQRVFGSWGFGVLGSRVEGLRSRNSDSTRVKVKGLGCWFKLWLFGQDPV